jgi:hypothetical protein
MAATESKATTTLVCEPVAPSTWPVAVRWMEGKGYGLVASRSISRGSLLFDELPLLATQSVRQRSRVLVCASCLAHLGPLELQLDILQGLATTYAAVHPRPSTSPEPVKGSALSTPLPTLGNYITSTSSTTSHYEMTDVLYMLSRK